MAPLLMTVPLMVPDPPRMVLPVVVVVTEVPAELVVVVVVSVVDRLSVPSPISVTLPARVAFGCKASPTIRAPSVTVVPPL